MSKRIVSISVFKAGTYTVGTADKVLVGGTNEIFRFLSKTVIIKRSLGQPAILTTSVIRGSEWATKALITMRTRLRIEYSDGTREMFRVREVKPDDTGSSDMEIEAWPLWTDLFGLHLRYVRTPSAVTDYSYPLRDREVSDLLTNVIFNYEFGMPNVFDLGSVSADIASVRVNIESGSNFIDLLYSIADQVHEVSGLSMEMETSYNHTTNKYSLSFFREAGAVAAERDPYNPDPSSRPISGPGQSAIRPNRIDLTYTDAQDDYYSRLIPFAVNQEDKVGIGGAWWEIVSYTEGTKTFVLEAGAIPYDDAYVFDALTSAEFFVEVDNLALTMSSDTDAKITTTDASSVSITVATHKAEYLTASKLRLYTTLGGGVTGATIPGSFVTYIHNPAADAARGVFEEVVEYDEIVPFDNEFAEASGSADMSSWSAPSNGTVKGVTSLPDGMRVFAPDNAYGPAVIGGTASTSQLIVRGNYTGLSASDTFTMEAGLSWSGQFTVESTPTYDGTKDETTITVTTVAEDDIEYNPDRTASGISLDDNHIVVEEVTEPKYVVNGSKSARVTTSLIGVGLRTDNIVIERTAEEAYLSAWASASLITGSVKLQVVDAVTGDVYPPLVGSDQAQWSGTEVRALEINGIKPEIEFGETRAFYVTMFSVEPNTVFHWDGLSLTKSTVAYELSPYMGKRDLFKAASREMTRSGGVQNRDYSARFYDVTHLDPSGGFNEVRDGSWCRIYGLYDEETDTYSLDASVRAYEVTEEFDLINGNYLKDASFNTERPSLADRLVLSKKRSRIPKAPVASGNRGVNGDYSIIVFRRSATLPATPSGSTIPPADWSSTPPVEDGNPLWMSTGKFSGDTDLLLGLWATPVQVDSPVQYYILPTNGTSIHNSAGTITLEARIVAGGQDALLISGDVRLYVDGVEVTEANDYATGSDGFTGVFDADDIAGSVVVDLLKTGDPIKYSVTLVDISDGEDAVYGYIEASGGLAWTQEINDGSWNPAGTTTDLDFTFVKAGVAVCRDAVRITRDSTGLLSVANTAHKDGDVSVVDSWDTTGNGTQALTVKGTFGGVSVAQTVITSRGGSDGSSGTNAKAVKLTASSYAVAYDGDGNNPNPSGTITLTATAQNFGTPYFKFTGNGITDETSFTAGSGDTDTFSVSIPATFFSSPLVLRVGVSDGDQAELAFDTITIAGVKSGAGGENGEDAYTVILTNEAHTLPTTNDDVVDYTGSGTEIIVYRGGTELNGITSGTPTTGQFEIVSATGTGITVGGISSAGNPVVIADHSGPMAGDTAKVDFVINIENIVTGAKKTQTLAKSNQGAKGDTGSGGAASMSVKLTAAKSVIVYNENGSSPDPSTTIVLTATAQNFDNPYFKFTGDGITDETSFTDGTGDTDTFSFPVPASFFSTPKTIRVGTSEANQTEVAFDTITIAAVKPGINGYTVVLTNEAHTLPVTNTDDVDYTGSGTQIIAYKGTTELNGITSGTPTVGQFKVTSVVDTDITAGTISSPSNPIVVGNSSAISGASDTAKIDFVLNLENVVTSLVKTQTISKSNQGENGAAGLPGSDGTFYEFVYKRAATQPTTPTGDGIPTGWSNDPVDADGNPQWMSMAEQEQNGTLLGTWSVPVKVSGVDIPLFESIDVEWGALTATAQTIMLSAQTVNGADRIRYKTETGEQTTAPTTSISSLMNANPKRSAISSGNGLGVIKTVWLQPSDGTIHGPWSRFVMSNDVVISEVNLSYEVATDGDLGNTNVRFKYAGNKNGSCKVEYKVDTVKTAPTSGTTLSSTFNLVNDKVIENLAKSTFDASDSTTTRRYLHYRLTNSSNTALVSWQWIELPFGKSVAFSSQAFVDNTFGTTYEDNLSVLMDTLIPGATFYCQYLSGGTATRTMFATVTTGYDIVDSSGTKYKYTLSTKPYSEDPHDSATYTVKIIDANANVIYESTLLAVNI